MKEMYVLTGGPGTGKSTVLQELAKLGYQTVPEAARMIIQEESAKVQGILPWTNLSQFQCLVSQKQVDLEAQVQGLAFLDRGRRDCLAYCQLGNIVAPAKVVEILKCEEYAGVFLIEPLSLYSQDEQRKEDRQTALELHERIATAYLDAGYALISVPCLEAKQRAEYILSKIVIQESLCGGGRA